jgi:hypothetical protein
MHPTVNEIEVIEIEVFAGQDSSLTTPSALPAGGDVSDRRSGDGALLRCERASDSSLALSRPLSQETFGTFAAYLTRQSGEVSTLTHAQPGSVLAHQPLGEQVASGSLGTSSAGGTSNFSLGTQSNSLCSDPFWGFHPRNT